MKNPPSVQFVHSRSEGGGTTNRESRVLEGGWYTPTTLSEQGGWERSLDGGVAPVILLWVPGPFPLHSSEVGVREGTVGITWGV